MAQLVEHHLAKVGVAGSSPVVRSRNFTAEANAPAVFFVFEYGAGLEPMRWNSVKKTAQWAVFRNSPEGFSLRGRGARSASMSPLCPLQSLLRRSHERRFFVEAARMTPLIHSPLSSAFLRVVLRVALLSFLCRDNMLICRIDGAAKLLEQKG